MDGYTAAVSRQLQTVQGSSANVAWPVWASATRGKFERGVREGVPIFDVHPFPLSRESESTERCPESQQPSFSPWRVSASCLFVRL